MSKCNACYPTDLHYQIKLNGKINQTYIPHILLHLERKNLLVTHKETILVVKEAAITELYDFFRDHMDTEQISFRIDQEEWKPVTDLPKTFDSQWIDTIITEELVTCHFQPIIDTAEEVYGYEILSRFKNQAEQPISPFEVFTAARTRNRTYALDRVCRMNAVRHAPMINKKVFINFIPTSIYSPEHCLKSTVELAHQLGIDPSYFVFEVVETEQVDDLDHLKKILTYYKEQGFEYALDDVGEGFSTIDVLQELSPNYMKLDMQFVQGVATDLVKQATAKKFLAAALEVGATPLAEGIERREDFIWLKNSGYQLFQGYLFGKPAPISSTAR